MQYESLCENERLQKQSAPKRGVSKVAEKNIKDIQTDATNTYGKDVGTHFPNGIITIYTVTLCLKRSTRMREVMGKMEAKYSSDNEIDDRCGDKRLATTETRRGRRERP